MQFTTLLVSALAAATAVVAAPLEKRAGGSGGQATYYYQGGNPGSCGNWNGDDAMIVAVNSAQMNGNMCGQPIWIQGNGKTIQATIADTCPTCDSQSLDLSVAAFQELSGLDAGVVPITWWT